MKSYLFLTFAIVFEVAGTLLLPVSQNFTKMLPTAVLFLSYAISFYLLTFAVQTIPIAVVYATWSGLGIFLIAIFGRIVFAQPLSWPTIFGLGLIVIGVSIVNVYSNAH